MPDVSTIFEKALQAGRWLLPGLLLLLVIILILSLVDRIPRKKNADDRRQNRDNASGP